MSAVRAAGLATDMRAAQAAFSRLDSGIKAGQLLLHSLKKLSIVQRGCQRRIVFVDQKHQ